MVVKIKEYIIMKYYYKIIQQITYQIGMDLMAVTVQNAGEFVKHLTKKCNKHILHYINTPVNFVIVRAEMLPFDQGIVITFSLHFFLLTKNQVNDLIGMSYHRFSQLSDQPPLHCFIECILCYYSPHQGTIYKTPCTVNLSLWACIKSNQHILTGGSIK